jgi:DNA-binding CsgD family transcriptional regulator
LQGLPLRHAACDYFGAARALLLIVDPFRDRAQASIEDIRGVLGVSGAEAMLLSLLHADVPLPEAANRLGISYETARSQLKNAFQRTGTRRQSEILQLLNNIAGGLQP